MTREERRRWRTEIETRVEEAIAAAEPGRLAVADLTAHHPRGAIPPEALREIAAAPGRIAAREESIRSLRARATSYRRIAAMAAGKDDEAAADEAAAKAETAEAEALALEAENVGEE